MSYIRDRLIQAGVTFYLIVSISFVLQKMLPGGPVDFLQTDIRQNPRRYGLSQNPTDEEVRELITQLVSIPPDQPLHEAYIDYLYQIFIEFDLGTSIVTFNGVPVADLILMRAPWTILISILGILYGLVASIVFGSLMAYYEGSKFDVGLTVSMIVDSAIPYYAAALVLLFGFGFQLGWFPTGGRVNPDATAGVNWPYVSSIIYHATLPALSFIVTGFGGAALELRANAIRVLGDDFLHVAELRGLSRYRISVAYLTRNAILPMYTSIVIGLGSIIGGSVLIEAIFQYPGMGLLLFDAAQARDFPLLMGGVLVTAGLFILGTLLADFTYKLVDPRADVNVSR